MIQKSQAPIESVLNQTSIIRFSFFCGRTHWNKLVQECLCPLLDKLEKSNLIIDYLVALSFELGDHIRLTCCVDSTLEYAIKKYVKRQVKHWFKTNPSYLAPQDFEITHLWMTFNNNSVHVNIFTDYFEQLHSVSNLPKKNSLQTAISFQIINYLCNEYVFDTESILSKAITLAVCSIENYLSSDCLHMITDLIRITNQNSEIAELGEVSLASIIDDFEDNSEFVVDYYKLLLAGEVGYTDKHWQKFISEYIIDDKDHLYRFVEVIRQTNLCLGLGPAMQTYVLIFIQQFVLLSLKQSNVI